MTDIMGEDGHTHVFQEAFCVRCGYDRCTCDVFDDPRCPVHSQFSRGIDYSNLSDAVWGDDEGRV